MAKQIATNTTAPSLKVLSEDKEHETGVSKVTTFRVDPDNVTFEDGFNVRTHDDTWDAHVDRLYTAMKNGASVPAIDVRVDSGKIIAVEGHARTLAARRLKKEVPEFTLEARQFRGNEQERVLHMLGTGGGQKPLTPLEQGIGYLRLVKYGLTSQQIADKLGVSSVTIDNGLTLAEAPVEVQNLIRSGVVSSTAAREAIKGGAEGVEALKAAAAKEEGTTDPVAKKGKKGKKSKKVTAKKLRGTAADKNTRAKGKKGKKGEKKQTLAEWNKELAMSVHTGAHTTEATFTKSEFLALASAPSAQAPTGIPGMTVGEGEMVVKVNKEYAGAAVAFLRANAPDEAAGLKEFADALELALL